MNQNHERASEAIFMYITQVNGERRDDDLPVYLKPVFKVVDSLCYIIGNIKKISQDLKEKNAALQMPASSFGSNLPKGTPFHLWKQRYKSINGTGPHNHLTAEEKDTPSASWRRTEFSREKS